MNEAARRIGILEQIARDQARRIDNLVSAVKRLEGQLALAGGGGSSGGASIGFFYIEPVAISAGSSAASQTIKYLVGGVATTYTTATVYNKMDAATVSTANKRIVVAPCGDGTYACVSQSC